MRLRDFIIREFYGIQIQIHETFYESSLFKICQSLYANVNNKHATQVIWQVATKFQVHIQETYKYNTVSPFQTHGRSLCEGITQEPEKRGELIK